MLKAQFVVRKLFSEYNFKYTIVVKLSFTAFPGKAAWYIAIKSAPDTYFLQHSYFIPRRALPLFKYHGTISCPTSVLTMPSYASMHALPTRNAVEILMQKRTDPRINAYRTLRRFFQSAYPSHEHNIGQYFREHSCSFARYLLLSYKDPELRINFTLPSFSQPRHLAHPPSEQQCTESNEND